MGDSEKRKRSNYEHRNKEECQANEHGRPLLNLHQIVGTNMLRISIVLTIFSLRIRMHASGNARRIRVPHA
jgi:hypothetical protein